MTLKNFLYFPRNHSASYFARPADVPISVCSPASSSTNVLDEEFEMAVDAPVANNVVGSKGRRVAFPKFVDSPSFKKRKHVVLVEGTSSPKFVPENAPSDSALLRRLVLPVMLFVTSPIPMSNAMVMALSTGVFRLHGEVEALKDKLDLANQEQSSLEIAMLVGRSQALKEVASLGIGLELEDIKVFDPSVEENYDRVIESFYQGLKVILMMLELLLFMLEVNTADWNKAQRRIEVKARSTLMMGIPNEHQLKFKSIKDAKQLMEAIEKRFGGIAATKKTQRNLLKQQYENFIASNSEMLDQTFNRLQKLNKADLDTMSMDDLYNNLNVYEPEVNTAQAVNTALGVSNFGTQVNAEILSNVECYNCYKIRHFARECIAPRSQDTKHKESTRRTMPIETPDSTTLVSCDGLGDYDWSDQAEEGPNYALIACTSTSSDSKIVDNYKKGLGYENYNDVPPPYPGNFMPLKLDLSFIGLDEFANKTVVKNFDAKTSERNPKNVRKNNDAPIIKQWMSDDEEEDEVTQPKNEPEIVKPSIPRIEFVKPKQPEKKSRLRNLGKILDPQMDLHDKGVIDSGCSRHMTGNMSYLTDYEEINEGYVAFGGNPKEGKITGKVKPLEYLIVKKIVEENLHIRFSENTPNVVGIKACDNVGQAKKEKEPIKDYILLPLWSTDPPFSQDPKSCQDDRFQPSSGSEKKVDEDPYINTFSFSSDHEDDDEKADINNIDTTIQVSPVPTIRINKDHPLDQVIRDLHSTTQTRNMSKNLEEHGFVSTIHQRTNHKDLQNYLFACFLSKEEPQKELCIAFEKMMHEKFQMSSMGELTFFLGLFTEVMNASTPIKTQKPLLKVEDGKEVDVHMYRSMIGSLMYLTSLRPDIMFVVCACARYQVNLKVSHLHTVKRIFSSGLLLRQNPSIEKHRCMLRVGKGFSRNITPLFPTMVVQNPIDEAIYKELDDRLVRAATTASSLKVEHDIGSKILRDTITQTWSERVLDLEKTKNTQALKIDSLKRRVKKIKKKQSSRTHKLKRLFKLTMFHIVFFDQPRRPEGGFYTMYKWLVSSGYFHQWSSKFADRSNKGFLVRVDQERFVKRVPTSSHRVLLLQSRAIPPQGGFYIVYTRVESSDDNEDLGEDASKQGRKIHDIDADEDITPVNDQDDEHMFDINDLQGEEVFV
nr:hypothetical protein [Tanacetum cinerariifolium]